MPYSALDHPANAGLRRYRQRWHRGSGIPPLAQAEDVARPYDSLGTHPDLVARLWDELQEKLPADCRVIFYGTPALMHPETKIVFAFAWGTHTYALRLPEHERAAALRAGATRLKHYPGEPSLDLTEIGQEWVLCSWLTGEEDWCFAAFELAASGR